MEKKSKTHREPLPEDPERLITLFKRAIELAEVEEISVTPDGGFVVRRSCTVEEPAWPTIEEDLEVDADFLLPRLTLEEAPFDPEVHPLQSLAEALRMITSQNLIPSYFFAPEGEWVASYLDLPPSPPPTHVLGLRVVTFQSELYREKFVVVGGATHYLSDVCYGVILDMGI